MCTWKILSLHPSLSLLQHSQSQHHNLPWRSSGQTPTCPAPFFICHPRPQVIPPHSCSRYDSEHPFPASISPCSTSKSLWLLELMSINSKILHIAISLTLLFTFLFLQKETLPSLLSSWNLQLMPSASLPQPEATGQGSPLVLSLQKIPPPASSSLPLN